MYYKRHSPSASVAYVTALIYASANDLWACPACPLVSSSKTKPCQFSLVQLRCSVHAFALADWLTVIYVHVFSSSLRCHWVAITLKLATVFVHDCRNGLTIFRFFTQGNHLSGKPGNDWKFQRCQGNVSDFGKNQGIVGENLVRENCPKTWLKIALPCLVSSLT